MWWITFIFEVLLILSAVLLGELLATAAGENKWYGMVLGGVLSMSALIVFYLNKDEYRGGK